MPGPAATSMTNELLSFMLNTLRMNYGHVHKSL